MRKGCRHLVKQKEEKRWTESQDYMRNKCVNMRLNEVERLRYVFICI